MVEYGPYIEYCCEVYVRRDYVIQCVLVCFLVEGVVLLILALLRRLLSAIKKSRDRSRLK